jgi:hypothetical protein
VWLTAQRDGTTTFIESNHISLLLSTIADQ